MLPALLFAVSSLQPVSCPDEHVAIAEAAAQVNAFDLTGAATRLDREPLRACDRPQITMMYLHGLIAARQAYAQGGDPASLRPVLSAVARLDAYTKGGSKPAEIAGLVLRAAASAAQSEREEMAVFLEHALRMESLQLDAGVSGAPIITAHEAAGDLWLQVHQYVRARDAYRNAVAKVGVKSRLTLGLARVAARLKQGAVACAEYHMLFERWHWATKGPTEIDEARLFIQQQCQPRRTGARRP